MARRTIFDDVKDLPWPVGVIAALISFALFQWYLTNPPENQILAALAPVVKMFGWFFTIMFLLAAGFSFLEQVIKGKRYNNTRTISEIRSLTWRQFESFVGEHFRQQGYSVVETPEGPDNGVDLVLRKAGEKTYVQCKQWKTNQVGVEKVRELLGSMAAGGAQHGIFVTSGTYTKPAKKLAFECGIELIDGNKLARLRGDEPEPMVCLTPHLEAAQAAPSCPKCGSEMVERTATKGANKGNAFWGCSTFPKCRGIRNF